ncbi:DnaJ-domain-containing protein [Ceratobasidium sp. AG-I]|nr:DnaJ-domain-containing protein [Ceratobasidium sp. AG-I]
MSLGTLLVSPLRRSLFATSFNGINIKFEPPRANCLNIWSRFLGARTITQTCISRATHYETLGVPQNATKGQIKSSFYGLSKKYHPDINPDTKDKFVAVNDAYKVLHDDRARRAYDRSLVGPSGTATNPGADAPWSYEPNLSRRPRATHAWESPRRHRAGNQHQHHPHPRTGAGYTHASPHARRATGGHGGYSHIPREDPNSPLSRLQRDSGIWRVVQVFGLLWVVVSLTGLTVHAGKG